MFAQYGFDLTFVTDLGKSSTKQFKKGKEKFPERNNGGNKNPTAQSAYQGVSNGAPTPESQLKEQLIGVLSKLIESMILVNSWLCHNSNEFLESENIHNFITKS